MKTKTPIPFLLDNGDWVADLRRRSIEVWKSANHGDLPKWLAALEALPSLVPSVVELNQRVVTVGSSKDATISTLDQLKTTLQQFIPWRKGPFALFDIGIETEWRSDLKWDRLKGALTSLQGKYVLDIGCGSGYHCWRMRGEGAKGVVGIEPSLLYVLQFQILQKYIQDEAVDVLPLKIEDLPPKIHFFDTVFSMGILYHRKDPQEHLQQLHSLMKEGGELVLESLVIQGEKGDILHPEDRYAQMRNVWNIPSLLMLEEWLREAGFSNVRCADVSQTTEEEQKTTEWMPYHSLSDFLDPKDNKRTVEGYPAPMRAVFLANK